MIPFAMFLLMAICRYDPVAKTFEIDGREVWVRASAVTAIRHVEYVGPLQCSQVGVLPDYTLYVVGDSDDLRRRVADATPQPKTSYVPSKKPQPVVQPFWWRRDSDILRDGTRSFRHWP